MVSFIKKNALIGFFVLLVLFFFKPVWTAGSLPLPADALVGLYHPFRDFYADSYPRGVPFRNFLITDPVRQLYPWRELAVSLLKNGEIPYWNPYTHAGTPLLANFQSAVFYPLNIIFLALNFISAWTFLVLLQPLLAGVFTYFYLKNLNLKAEACYLGAVSFSFSGFFVAWLEWNTLLQVALWLPLLLLIIDKTLPLLRQSKQKKRLFFLFFTLTSATAFYWLAGHFQTAVYLWLTVLAYFLVRVWQQRPGWLKSLLFFTAANLAAFFLTGWQNREFWRFLKFSGRGLDRLDWQQEGWFIPFKHLVQFVAPDFFGNPATLNYTGVWNYAEMVGYIGIFSLLMVLVAVFWRRDKKTAFFAVLTTASLVLASDNFLARLPFQWRLPLWSTAQPTRLLFLIDFSLAVLAALGFDFLLRRKIKIRQFLLPIVSLVGVLAGLLLMAVMIDSDIARRNLVLPAVILVAATILSLFYLGKNKRLSRVFFSASILGILLLVSFDTWRFAAKFTPFSSREYLFPQTAALQFLQNQSGLFRIMTTDERLLPANFSTVYRLQSVTGYDPLYLKNYAELVSAWVRGRPDISPFSFNRIIVAGNYQNRLTDLLNVRYVLSLEEIVDDRFRLVFSEGQTKIYENQRVMPRFFLAESVLKVTDKQAAINALFDPAVDLTKQAVVSANLDLGQEPLAVEEKVSLLNYQATQVVLQVSAATRRLLVLSDVFYPAWQVFIDGQKSQIQEVNYAFRGVVVPAGEHRVEFVYQSL